MIMESKSYLEMMSVKDYILDNVQSLSAEMSLVARETLVHAVRGVTTMCSTICYGSVCRCLMNDAFFDDVDDVLSIDIVLSPETDVLGLLPNTIDPVKGCVLYEQILDLVHNCKTGTELIIVLRDEYGNLYCVIVGDSFLHLDSSGDQVLESVMSRIDAL